MYNVANLRSEELVLYCWFNIIMMLLLIFNVNPLKSKISMLMSGKKKYIS